MIRILIKFDLFPLDMIKKNYPALPLEEKNIISHFRSKNASLPLHKSPLSIKCKLAGNEIYYTRENKYDLDASGYLLINEGTECEGRINSVEETESLSVFFSKSMTEKILENLVTPPEFLLNGNIYNHKHSINFFEKLYAHDTFISPILLKIRTASLRGFDDSEWLNEQLYLLLENLVNVHEKIFELIKKLPPVKLSTKVEIYKRVHKAKDYMDANFCSDITIESIAKESCLSEFHFLRSFKTIFKKTPRQYIINKRLGHAMELLRFSDKSVTDVCYEVGFNSPGTFSWLFRKKFGLNPENLKNSYQYFLARIANIKA